jgi:type IV fimbrial biogenesis protein FimT
VPPSEGGPGRPPRDEDAVSPLRSEAKTRIPSYSRAPETLVEACIVIAILAITVSSAVPSFKRLIVRHQLQGAANQLATDIQFARAESVARNLPLRLSVKTQAWGSCYFIHTGPADACRCESPAPAVCDGEAQQIKTASMPASDGVEFSANVPSVLFDPLHGTSTPAGTFKHIAGGQEIRNIVNVMGRVRSCSPSTAAVSGLPTC